MKIECEGDVNEKMDGWQRIPIRGGRGIVVVDNIDKVFGIRAL